MLLAAWEKAASKGALPPGPPEGWRLDLPKNPAHGDYAANIALMGASAAKLPPRKVAEILIAGLEDPDKKLAEVSIAGPGFINLRLEPRVWRSVIAGILAEGDSYGRTEVGAGKKVQVEFVSANPTGPLHVGHGRGAAIGDATARILTAAGFTVEREYYVNDAGNQIATLGGSVYLRYLEHLGREVEFPDNFYKGDYIKDMAKKVLEAEGDRYASMDRDEAVAILGSRAGDQILGEIREDLEAFGVTFDRWYSERSLYDRGEVARVLKLLEESGAAYRHEGALWLKTSGHGDEKDRVVQRDNGLHTYFASDIAYHANKFERGFDKVIDIWGADHHGYIARVKGALTALDLDAAKLDVALVQFVSLFRDGAKVSMSTRSGDFVTLRELRAEVGNDACRFFYLQRKCDQALDFDLTLAKTESSDNPVYYVQYAHARICSVLAQWNGPAAELATADLAPLTGEKELALCARIAEFPATIAAAAQEYAPHTVGFYVRELAAEFHGWYNAERLLVDDEAAKRARLALAVAVRQVLKNGLRILGVSAPETM